MPKLAFEPPIRLIFKAVYSAIPVSVETRALWDISPRPNYLNGILLATQQAKFQGVKAISVVEFGVAGGNGLIAMQDEAMAVEKATGIEIKVFGFDNGAGGLPPFIGDHRDHPDVWQVGDYPMDEAKLRSKLKANTKLILGNIRDTVPEFVRENSAPPIGFISIDVDLYSSTMQALKILSLPGSKKLNRTCLYFDDIEMMSSHKFAGELLAIDDFNSTNQSIKIDQLHGFPERPFPEKSYLKAMYVAHDLSAISKYSDNNRVTPLISHALR